MQPAPGMGEVLQVEVDSVDVTRGRLSLRIPHVGGAGGVLGVGGRGGEAERRGVKRFRAAADDDNASAPRAPLCVGHSGGMQGRGGGMQGRDGGAQGRATRSSPGGAKRKATTFSFRDRGPAESKGEQVGRRAERGIP